MSRSGYCEDIDDVLMQGRCRARVNNAIRSRRGRAFLEELAAAMDAMPEKVLIADDLIDEEGDCCAIGVVCKSRGVSVEGVDPEECDRVAELVGINKAMVAEIVYENDECGPWRSAETPAERWTRMREWVDRQLAMKPLAKS